MAFEDRFKNIAILGAAGKMGSGILYLNTLYVSQLKLSEKYKSETFVIHAIDQSHERLNGLLTYVRGLLLKWAEKNIVWLRNAYDHRSDLIENGEIILAYVTETMDMIKVSTNIDEACEARLVFEAVLEDIELKIKLFREIKIKNDFDPWFLTNTSSIPINELNDRAHLNGNIIGCHFYNPPAIQKLIEVIEIKDGNPDLKNLVYEFGNALRKVMVPSNDIAGFIGNGFFMRDLLFGLSKTHQLRSDFSFAESVLLVDTITRDFMLRPMGIIQLADYVGIDVCSFILNVMNKHLHEDLHSPLLIDLMDKKVIGGQYANGSQKSGLFAYEKGQIASVYDIDKQAYVPVGGLQEKINVYRGELPTKLSWKELSRNHNKNELIEDFFLKLKELNSDGSKLAMEYMKAMKNIGLQLVENGVTDSSEHVNMVMMTGFHHIYGPINSYC